ncbi:MAG: hypothetical protein NTX24_03100 [Candidatus Pacearchaeota archaeon]|nr:hypothetical protein [Candidatus Pacearchaeota archaeon]
MKRLKLRGKNKKAAFEMSITTIVILVIAMTMLILGMVLVRKMMCGAMGLTTDINDKVRGQIDDLFQSTGGEVQCIGSGTGAVDIIPGKVNYIWCGIKSSQKLGEQVPVYDIRVMSSIPPLNTLGLIGQAGWKGPVSTSDIEPKKIIRLDISKDSPEGPVQVYLEVYKDGKLILSPTLDLNVRRLDWFRGTIC